METVALALSAEASRGRGRDPHNDAFDMAMLAVKSAEKATSCDSWRLDSCGRLMAPEIRRRRQPTEAEPVCSVVSNQGYGNFGQVSDMVNKRRGRERLALPRTILL